MATVAATTALRRRQGALPAAGQFRVVIEGVSPEIDAGQFPIKRAVGGSITVQADVFADGHDEVAAALLYRHESSTSWKTTPMHALGNDRWEAAFAVEREGMYRYTLRGWIDAFSTWQHDFAKRVDAEQDVAVDLQIGARLVQSAADRAKAGDKKSLQAFARRVRTPGIDAVLAATSGELAALVARYPDLSHATTYARELTVAVDRERAQFSTWYELFPRSTGSRLGQHGSFRDCLARLPGIAAMGFDVLYFPPIHPIGQKFRKGKNNTTEAEASDPGSPWAIGGTDGGHKAIHPDLGTLADLQDLQTAARRQGIELALDIAFQCSPDHPYVTDHPQWFRQRPDGTIQYAENPPKKYQDIYPFDFESDDWQALWTELRNVVLFWADQGIRVFRVDNPHTKPFPFWEWLIAEVKREYPECIFLAEAFTRPKIMYRLAKIGFTQSYTYFAWRTTATDLMEYLTELTQTPVSEYFRPNFWPNTPDILTEELQSGERATFAARFLLAATLAASYGIYGPAFELLEHVPVEQGREEYLNSEKYEIRQWDLTDPRSLAPLITQVNAIRRAHPALQSNAHLRFHRTDNPQLLAYSKRDASGSDRILTIVNLDPRYTQAGWTDLDLGALDLVEGKPFNVSDLLTHEQYVWRGARNYVELDPVKTSAHIFEITPVRSSAGDATPLAASTDLS